MAMVVIASQIVCQLFLDLSTPRNSVELNFLAPLWLSKAI